MYIFKRKKYISKIPWCGHGNLDYACRDCLNGPRSDEEGERTTNGLLQ